MNFCVDSLLWMKHEFIASSEKKTKKQTKQWTSPGQPAPKKAKTVKSAGNVIASFLGCTRYNNSYRLPSIEANDQWWLLRSLTGPFQQHFKEKNISIWWRRNCSSQDNARVHTCTARWPNLTNSATNCFPIQHIRQI